MSNVQLSGGALLALAGLAVLTVGGLYLYSQRDKLAKAAGQAAAKVNPANRDNLVNSAVSSAGAAVTGDSEWSLGFQLADWFSPSVRAANESLRTPKPKPATQSQWARGAGETDAGTGDPYSPFNVGA